MTEQGATTDSRNIVERMSAVMADVKHVGKTGQNNEQQYNFRPIDEFMNELHGPLTKHGVVVTPRVLDRTSFERQRNNHGGVTRVVEMLVEFTFHAPDGSTLTTVTAGEGADVADKATNKAMAGALKYAIMQTFMVPTRELNDGDADTPEIVSEQRSQQNVAEQREIASTPPRAQIMEKLDEACTVLGKSRAELTKKWRAANGVGAVGELDDPAKTPDVPLYRFVVGLQPYVQQALAQQAAAEPDVPEPTDAEREAARAAAQGVLCDATNDDSKHCTGAAGHDGQHVWW